MRPAEYDAVVNPNISAVQRSLNEQEAANARRVVFVSIGAGLVVCAVTTMTFDLQPPVFIVLLSLQVIYLSLYWSKSSSTLLYVCFTVAFFGMLFGLLLNALVLLKVQQAWNECKSEVADAGIINNSNSNSSNSSTDDVMYGGMMESNSSNSTVL